jgi:hypothetical protein
MSLTDAYDGDAAAVSDEQWEELGFNVSAAVHTDIVSTNDRTVTAEMRDGSERVIYADGQFQTDEATDDRRDTLSSGIRGRSTTASPPAS